MGVEQIIEKQGLKGTAELLVRAQMDFLATQRDLPEAERLTPMTAGEWREAFNAMVDEDGEAEFWEGEEEEWLEGEEEEGNADETVDPEDPEDAVQEPAAKKPRPDE